MGEPRRVHVATFGCRVNQADSEGMLSDLAGRGLALADDHRSADVVVINSCTVTHRSDTDIRKLVHRIHRENPGARVVVTGCYAQRDPEALAALRGTAAVVGHSDAGAVGEVVARLLDGPAPEAPLVLRAPMDTLVQLPPVEPVSVVHDRTRPFVKIQDGCDARCTYCVIPSVRGPARSADPDKVVASVAALVAGGAREVVLAGVHLGAFRGTPRTGLGETEPGHDLAALVGRVLEVPGLAWLRMSAIEPMAFPLALADLAARPPTPGGARLAPHFHLPLQSGCDRTLKRMARPYRTRDYAALLAQIRARLPDACLAADVIAGFPGETDADFAETLAFVETCGLDQLHVFSYSDRPGVPSTRLPDKVPSPVTKARVAALIATSERLWDRFLGRWAGRTVEALTLARGAPDVIDALTPSYVPVRIASATLAANTAVQVRLGARAGARLTAEMV